MNLETAKQIVHAALPESVISKMTDIEIIGSANLITNYVGSKGGSIHVLHKAERYISPEQEVFVGGMTLQEVKDAISKGKKDNETK